MAQYVNCGNSPQALRGDTDFNSLAGACENPNASALEGNVATDAGGSRTFDGASTGADTTMGTVVPTQVGAGTRPISDSLPRGSFLAFFIAVASLLVMEW